MKVYLFRCKVYFKVIMNIQSKYIPKKRNRVFEAIALRHSPHKVLNNTIIRIAHNECLDKLTLF